VEEGLWPRVETFLGSHDVAGLAVAVVCKEEVVSRGFGVRDVGSGASVTPETMFHLASVSKPFVATAIVSLATALDAGEPVLDLDAPIVEWVPEFTLADGRAGEITARRLLSHSSGLPDVADYGWHDPQLGDDALSEFARSLSGWRLQAEPGSAFSYSNAGFELLGLLLSRATGTTFENAVRQHVLTPLGMRNSTFLRGEVPTHLAASPHVGMPLTVPEGAYPYTRRHAPSSTLHSNLAEMCRWMEAHLEPAEVAAGSSDRQSARLDPGLLDLMWRPVVPVAEPPWEEAAALGWGVGSYRGHRTLSHSGADPGFGSRLVLVPERRSGVVVLANSNTVPTSAIAAAALDIALADPALSVISRVTPEELGEGVAAMRALLAPGRRPRRRDVDDGRAGRRSGGLPPTGRGRAGRVRPRRRGVHQGRVGSDRAAPHEPGLAPPASVDRVAPGLIRRLDDDRMGPPGRRASRPGEEPPPTRPRPRPRQRRGHNHHEQPPVGMTR
jgi:CubicO group peptidase (beta-lactamase class C family)